MLFEIFGHLLELLFRNFSTRISLLQGFHGGVFIPVITAVSSPSPASPEDPAEGEERKEDHGENEEPPKGEETPSVEKGRSVVCGCSALVVQGNADESCKKGDSNENGN